jgi:predicted amidohydrolase YtcJ
MMGDDGTGLLITGARVYTADLRQPWAEALVIQGNHILYVGAEDEARARAGAGTEEVHVPGGLVVPGLNDGHIHMSGAAYELTVLNLEGAYALPELQARLRDYAAAHPERAWIEGYGLAYEPLTGLERPERVALDEAVSDRPVFVRAVPASSAAPTCPAPTRSSSTAPPGWRRAC